MRCPILCIPGTSGGSSGTYSLSGKGLLTVGNREYRIRRKRQLYGRPAGPIPSTTSTSGTNLAGAGSTTLTWGGMLAAGYEAIGFSGSGSFTQSGGINTVNNGAIYLGSHANSFGTYALNGGLLSTS